MNKSSVLLTAGAVVFAADGRQAPQSNPHLEVARGFLAFLDPNPAGLAGNGRSCADCHMPTDRFQLSPAGVEARFQRLQQMRQHNPAADDPLFRPIDADDFRLNGEAASDYGAHALVFASNMNSERGPLTCGAAGRIQP